MTYKSLRRVQGGSGKGLVKSLDDKVGIQEGDGKDTIGSRGIQDSFLTQDEVKLD